jgi:hypothetical protein
MRYYLITITPLNGSKPLIFSSLTDSGNYNGSCLELNLDIFQFDYGSPAANSFIRLKGISYDVISNVSNLNGAEISVELGMSKGLPFANPKQSGLIIKGKVQQAFANWQGNQVSLELIIVYSLGSLLNPVNLSVSWQKGQTMEQMIRQTLGIAFPTIPITGKLNPNLIYTENQGALYYTLEGFAELVGTTSFNIIKNSLYIGARITLTQAGFYLYDGTEQTTPIAIDWYDIIGNLTWLDTYNIQAKLVMRNDLALGKYVTFPQGVPVLNLYNTNNYSQYRNNTNFQGTFYLTLIHHMGNSRAPDENSWVTVINCILLNQTADISAGNL